MPEISTVKPRIQSRARLGRAIFVAGKTLIISILKTLYALWLEVTGLMFAFLAVMGTNDLIRHYRADHLADHKRTVAVLAFTLVCGWFTVLSYVRARKARK
jgi:hypothetical protein